MSSRRTPSPGSGWAGRRPRQGHPSSLRSGRSTLTRTARPGPSSLPTTAPPCARRRLERRHTRPDRRVAQPAHPHQRHASFRPHRRARRDRITDMADDHHPAVLFGGDRDDGEGRGCEDFLYRIKGGYAAAGPAGGLAAVLGPANHHGGFGWRSGLTTPGLAGTPRSLMATTRHAASGERSITSRASLPRLCSVRRSQ